MARGFRAHITTNAPVVAANLKQFARQIPFATANALNSTAFDARDEVRARMGETFTIRSQRVPKGVVVRKATKRNQVAFVGVRDGFLAQHITGKLKRAKGGSRVAIPTSLITRRRTATGKIPKSQKPRRVRERKGVYVNDGAIRRSFGKRSRARDKRSVLYFLRNRVRIKQTWPFDRQVLQVAQRVYRDNFRRSFARAVKTARR